MTTNSKSMITDLTEGSVVKLLLRFAMPLFFSNALQAIYNIVDMIVVGQYIGGTGMSAVSIGGDLLHFMTFLAIGFSSAGQVIISRNVGAGNHAMVRKTIGTMFSFLLGLSILLSVFVIVCRHGILHLLNTPAESYEYTLCYTVVCAAGLFFIYGYNIVSAILRGMGDSKRPFVFIAVAAVLNIVLDLYFVVGMNMEVRGAALATVIGQAASFISSVIYLYVKKESFGFDFKPKSFLISGDALKPLVTLGIPMAIQSAAINFSKITLTAWINSYGVLYSALAGIFNKISTMSGVISQSFSTSGSSMTGQNLGARKYERIPAILRTVLVCMLSVTILMTAVMLLAPGTVFRLITNDPSVLSAADVLIFPIVLNLFGCATRTVAFSLINGSGNSRLNLLVAILDGIVGRISFAWFLGFFAGLGCLGFWLGDSAAGFFPILIASVYYISGKWKE